MPYSLIGFDLPHHLDIIALNELKVVGYQMHIFSCLGVLPSVEHPGWRTYGFRMGDGLIDLLGLLVAELTGLFFLVDSEKMAYHGRIAAADARYCYELMVKSLISFQIHISNAYDMF